MPLSSYRNETTLKKCPAWMNSYDSGTLDAYFDFVLFSWPLYDTAVPLFRACLKPPDFLRQSPESNQKGIYLRMYIHGESPDMKEKKTDDNKTARATLISHSSAEELTAALKSTRTDAASRKFPPEPLASGYGTPEE